MALISSVRFEARGVNRSFAEAVEQADAIAFMKNTYPELSSNGNFTVEGSTLVCTVANGNKA